jgi:hypothetical protein
MWHTGDGEAGAEPIPINSLDFLQPGSGTKVVLGDEGLTEPINRFGPELTCGQALVTSLVNQTTKIAIIKHAIGGTRLAVEWLPGGDATTSGDGSYYVGLQTAVTSAMAAIRAAYPSATVSIVGMFWVQGEGDRTLAAHYNAYETNLTNFIADVRLTYGASLPFVFVGLSDYYTGTGSDTIRTAQANVDAAVTATALLPSTTAVYPMETVIAGGHYTPEGNQILGTAMAAAMIPLL